MTMTHKIRNIMIATAITTATVFSLGGTAMAQQYGSYSSRQQVTQKLESQGYFVLDLDRERYGWEAEVIDGNRYKLDLQLDRKGNIIYSEYDD